MNVTFACPQCRETIQSELSDQDRLLACPRCDYEHTLPVDALQDGQLTRCVVCPSTELFVRKNFSQRLGMTIIVSGFIASSITWYFYLQVWTFAILIGTALLDVLLYLLVDNLLQCYRCQAQYRGVETLDEHQGFDLETHEKYRQQAARLAKADPLSKP